MRLHLRQVWILAGSLALALGCGSHGPGNTHSSDTPPETGDEPSDPGESPSETTTDPGEGPSESVIEPDDSPPETIIETDHSPPVSVIEPGDSLSDTMLDPGNSVSLALSATQADELAEVEPKLAEAEGLDPETFAERYAVPFAAELGGDPSTAAGLALIQDSALALNETELAALAQNGFVISAAQGFAHFTDGYEAIYAHDLPVFVSADSILYALHRSYDSILRLLESSALLPSLSSLLEQMRAALPGAALGEQQRADADFYLTVAHDLLSEGMITPEAGASASDVARFVGLAESATGKAGVELFGVQREVDFSQFEPRGHYEGNPTLERYFRAMMWLGRVDFRLLETQLDGSQVFHRRQLKAAVALRELMNDAALRNWDSIDRAIGLFVGEHDSMTPPQIDSLLSDLGAGSASDLDALPDARIAQAIVDGGYGTQRIASHLMCTLGGETLPLNSTFMLFGQRYVVDSHVFSNLVADRVGGGTIMRMMPDPLDIAFAALGNDQAGQLLGPELEQYGYAGDLASMRVLVDAHPEQYWQDNLYSLWLSSLRTLSPTEAVGATADAGLPAVAGTEAWGRRLLNTQLASWAELRHDTLLYAKQSYTMGYVCEFPDAYVEPYPEFFAKIVEYAERGQQVLAQLESSAQSFVERVSAHLAHFGEVAGMLQEMAVHQRTGTPHTQAHLDFINQVVQLVQILNCGTRYGAEGWYPGLFFDPSTALEAYPTIADVHTQPTDEDGVPVGRVLHVGTGYPRLLVVTMNTCSGMRAYAGVVSSYYEHVTGNYERLTDSSWVGMVSSEPDQDWLVDLIGGG